MKKIYYEKIGRKYVPVAEYDSEYLDSLPASYQPTYCTRRFATKLWKSEWSVK